MTTPSDPAIEAAAQAMRTAAINGGLTVFPVSFYERNAELALTAAAPAIQAEAWDAVIARIDLGTPYMVDKKYVAGAEWVRSQIIDVLKADQLEGKAK